MYIHLLLVVSQAKSIGGESIDTSMISIVHADKNWKEQAQEVVNAMAVWLQVDPEYHFAQQSHFQEFLLVTLMRNSLYLFQF